jgi:hypothetical protein
VALGVLAAAVLLTGRAAWGYIEAAYTLGQIIQESTNVLEMRVEQVDKQKKLIVYRKIRDIKGKWPAEVIKHSIAGAGLGPTEVPTIMNWADVGQTAVFFTNGGASETCISNYWYQTYAGDWWSFSHGEPYLLRTFAGRPEKLVPIVATIVAGQEAIAPCMVDGDKKALQTRAARIQRLKVSLKLMAYDPKRDFVGWGGEDFRLLEGMPGFTHLSGLTRIGPGARGAIPIDYNGDGRMDVLLYGDSRVVLLENADGALNEVALPVEGGAGAAAWADFNGDGNPDLLLATASGPKLLMNLGKGFKDVSNLLPPMDYYNLRAAAWIDYDGDGRPDVLLADGFRGLRLYRNKGFVPVPGKVKLGPWSYIGPFDNTGGKGFETVYPPEKEIDLVKQYDGKGQKVAWKEGSFTDGQVNSLLDLVKVNENAVAYVYREIQCKEALELPISLGSDDTLSVWLNGQKVHSENVARSCQPDQVQLVLKLRPGVNALLMKICQTSGAWAFCFASKEKDRGPSVVGGFEDVSDKVGLGANGIASGVWGDHLAVADVNGDGRQDFLYSGGQGVVVLNTPQGFVEAKDSGISYKAGGVIPVFGDFDGDKAVDLFVPQTPKSKLFRNDGKGHFSDVTDKSGALAGFTGTATCAAWTDFNNTGRLDLLVGCLKGPNRFFRNLGNGTFADGTEELGLHQKIFNTKGIAVLHINKDGVLDVVFNNEAQETTALLGNPARLGAPAKP